VAERFQIEIAVDDKGTPVIKKFYRESEKTFRDIAEEAQKSSSKAVGSVEKLRKSFEKFRESAVKDLEKIGSKAKWAFAALAGGIASSVKSFSSLEAQLGMVATMLDKSTMKYLPSYKEGLRRLAIESGQSTAVLSSGLYNILSATIEAKDAMKVLELSTKGAIAGFTTADVIVRSLTSAMLQYKNMSPEKIVDVMFAALQKGKFTMEEFASAIPGVLGLGSQLNLKFGELAATTAFLSKKGFATVSEAATGLEGMLTRLLTPTSEFEKQLEELGIQGRGTAITVDELRKKLGEDGLYGTIEWLMSLDPGGKLVEQLFRRKEAMIAMSGMISDMEAWKEDIEDTMNSAGATEEAFAKATATLEYQFRQLKETVIIVAGIIGE